MGQQATPGGGIRCVARGTEYNVVADRVGVRIHGAGRRGGLCVGMHAHAPEVTAEALLKELARVRIERLSGAGQHLIDDGRRGKAGTGKPVLYPGWRCSRLGIRLSRETL